MGHPKRVAVAMLGARRSYAVPRLLHQAHVLERFFTDLSANSGWPALLNLIPRRLRPASVRRLLERMPGIPMRRTTAFTSFGWEYWRRRRSGPPAGNSELYLWAGRRFGDLVVRHGIGEADAVHTFNTAALEILCHARELGRLGIVDQTIAPLGIQRALEAEERRLHPGWEKEPPEDAAAADLADREREEWDAADIVLCGSEFVRDSLRAARGPVEKAAVVPYGLGAPMPPFTRLSHPGPLRVLTVGAVGLRKGSPYVLAAARELKGVATFRMVGGHDVLPEARARLAEVVELTGSVPRAELPAHYAWADVFLLPSVCEGNAEAANQALSAGMPVIATPNTGTSVRDGEDGFIVPVRDSHAIAACILKLASEPALLDAMSRHARRNSSHVSLESYRSRLLHALSARRTEKVIVD